MLELATNENKETILAGDLNCNYLVPNDHKEIKDALRINGFKQLIQSSTRTTRKAKTLIDIIATTDKTKICNSIVYANSFSDHDLSGIVRKMHVQKFVPKTILTRDFSKYNKEAFKDDLQNVDWVEVLQTGEINERINAGWDLFKQKLTAVIDRHAPFVERRKRGRSCTWLTKEIKQKMHERDYHFRKARQSGCEREWSTYKRLRNAVTEEIRQSKANSCRKMFRDNIEKPKDFWKQIKRSYPSNKKSPTSNVFRVEGELVSDKKKISNGFCSFFTNIGCSLQRDASTLNSKTWQFFNGKPISTQINPKCNVFKFRTIELNEITTALRSIKVSK
eukprot:Seg3541.2 transcript_id=Seg3541.2/GoldUCD/mRNA.D3Y31 product="hypothetical protein" protein_id=Seg3541.2/GoldUCD/D3Y31